MSAFMLEYWDKENWNVTLSENPRVMAGLEHGAREGVGKGIPKRVKILFGTIFFFFAALTASCQFMICALPVTATGHAHLLQTKFKSCLWGFLRYA